MSTGYLAPPAKFQPLDNNGNPVPGGKLYTYVSGTTTPLATYTDVTMLVPNANPVILDAGGRCTLFLPPGTSYTFVFKTAADALIWTQNDIQTTVLGAAVTKIIAGTSLALTSTGSGGTGDVTIGLDTTAALTLTNNITTSGILTVSGFGTHYFSGAGVGGMNVVVRNVDDGIGNRAGAQFVAGTTTGGITAYAQSFVSADDAYASGVTVFGAGAGGLTLAAEHASGSIKFFAGDATNVKMSLSAAGVLTVSGFGTHTFSESASGTNQLTVANSRTTDVSRAVVLVSGGSGVSSYVGHTLLAGTTAGGVFGLSQAYTTSGPYVAAGVALVSDGAGGLSIAAAHASGEIRFYAGGTVEKARLATGGANKSSFTLYGSTQVAIALDTTGAIYADATSVRVVGANLAEMAITAAGGWAVATANGVGGTGALALSATGTLSLNGATVSFGANDSGGAGYKVLRVPN